MSQIFLLIIVVIVIIFLARRLFTTPSAKNESSGTTIDAKPVEKSAAEINAEVAAKEQNIAESAEAVAEKVVEQAQQASAAAAEKLDEAQDQAAEAAEEVAEKTEQAVSEATEKASEKAQSAAENVAHKTEQAVSEAAAASVSNEVPDELQTPVAELEQTEEPVARHRLYQQITESSYKNRSDAAWREISKVFSQRHVAEFAAIAKPLKKANGGKLPHVATFQNYATLLAEDGDYAGAIEVCEQALAFGLDDKTKTGFAGRIERIQKQQAKA